MLLLVCFAFQTALDERVAGKWDEFRFISNEQTNRFETVSEMTCTRNPLPLEQAGTCFTKIFSFALFSNVVLVHSLVSLLYIALPRELPCSWLRSAVQKLHKNIVQERTWRGSERLTVPSFEKTRFAQCIILIKDRLQIYWHHFLSQLFFPTNFMRQKSLKNISKLHLCAKNNYLTLYINGLSDQPSNVLKWCGVCWDLCNRFNGNNGFQKLAN